MEKVTARVFRYDPSTDDTHRYETYEVPYEKGMRVLGVLLYIQENVDTSLAFRYSCRRKRCGSCGVLVNGKPGLACMEEAKEEMVIEPLPNLPIVRDLVVETNEYEERIQSIRPYLIRKNRPEREPEKLLPSNFTAVRPLNQCIECFSCMSACPVNGLKWEGFSGPATLIQLARRMLDPRDDMDRIPAAGEAGFEHCVACYACVNACPVEIGIVEGVIENIRKKYTEKKPSLYGNYNKAWGDLIVKNGLVNPFTLMRKVSTFNKLVSNMLIGIKFLLKGKISLKNKKISNIDEIRTIQKVIGEKR
jgi:fumarate reductase (CoM/CoB) subunit B